MSRITKVNTDVVQWVVRNAFEQGFRASNPYPLKSQVNPNYDAWFDAWLKSDARAMLVANGIIGEEDGFR